MPGHLHDLNGADALLPAVVGRFGALLADRAYDAQERVVDILNAAGIAVVIPSKINRTYRRKHDLALYGACYLIENFFAKALLSLSKGSKPSAPSQPDTTNAHAPSSAPSTSLQQSSCSIDDTLKSSTAKLWKSEKVSQSGALNVDTPAGARAVTDSPWAPALAGARSSSI